MSGPKHHRYIHVLNITRLEDGKYDPSVEKNLRSPGSNVEVLNAINKLGIAFYANYTDRLKMPNCCNIIITIEADLLDEAKPNAANLQLKCSFEVSSESDDVLESYEKRKNEILQYLKDNITNTQQEFFGGYIVSIKCTWLYTK